MSNPSSQPNAIVNDGPLAGVRVLDMSRLLPGPFCSQLLCDLGAEVIKVEDFEGGDYARSYPPLMSDGNSALFHALNRGKKSVQIDLKTDAGRVQFMHLLERADILIETFRPGVLKKLGFEPTSLQARFPSLIICSISGYGQTGPDSLRAGHDINYLAKSGALAVMAHPSLLPVQVADIAGGSYPAAVQILAALRRRDQTGKGALIDVSMTDNVYSLMTMNLARYAATQEPFSQGKDWLAGGTPCYEVYRTSDGFISVGALEPKFWSSLCTSLNRPDLIEKQFPDGAKEIQHVKDELQTEFIKRTNEEWKVFFKNKDCCVEIVSLPEGLSSRDPHLAHREVDLTISFPDGSTLRTPKTPIRMSGAQLSAQPGPTLGQHNQQFFKAKL